jgi:dipeptidyl aminopeptidase/acylaminoacyl peptidase
MSHLRVVLVLAAAIVLDVLATSSQATPPGANGRIVFERLRFQNTLWGELFVMNTDGTDVRKITHPPNGTEDTNPDWSPDGSRIVFSRAPSTGAHSIWTVEPDGTGLRRLTPYCPPGAGIPKCAADDGWPVWSPDGNHIAFQRLSGALRPKGATVDNAKRIYKDELVVTDEYGRHPRALMWLGPWARRPADSRVVAEREAARIPREERQRWQLRLPNPVRRQRGRQRAPSPNTSFDPARGQDRLVA